MFRRKRPRTKELDYSGNPCGLRQTRVYRKVGDDVIVSTIWRSSSNLSFDSSILQLEELLGERVMKRADLSAPGDWETMVFPAAPNADIVLDWAERDFARYDSEEAALEGHQEMIEKWLRK